MQHPPQLCRLRIDQEMLARDDVKVIVSFCSKRLFLTHKDICFAAMWSLGHGLERLQGHIGARGQ